MQRGHGPPIGYIQRAVDFRLTTLQDQITQGLLTVVLTPTDHMKADIFTKVLSAKRMVWLIRRVFGLDHPMIDAMEAATRKMTPHQQVVVSNIFQHDSFCKFAAVREYGVRLLLSCPCRGEALRIEDTGRRRMLWRFPSMMMAIFR